MERPRRQLFTALLALFAAVTAQAQEWTVIELPAKASEMYQLIKDRFDCDYTDLPTKYNLSHVKFTGTDFRYDDWNYDGQLAMQALVKNAKVIDFSEVRDNPESMAYYEQSYYYDYPGPGMAFNFMGYGNDSVEHILLPKTLRRIPRGFESFVQLTGVTWPDEVVELSINQFSMCPSLKEITIPEGVEVLPEECFKYCSSLTSVTLPSSLRAMEKSAFRGCGALERLSIPDSVKSLGNGCFSGCGVLKDVNIPQAVTTIGSSAFYDCKALESITLPPGLTAIQGSLFSQCASLKSVNIPDSVTLIEASAFYGCTALRQLELPKGMKQIGNSAFYDSGLEQLVMPDSVVTIGEGLFQGCRQLESVHLSRGLTTIPAYTFKDCAKLTEVNIPRRVTTIDKEAFSHCLALQTPQLPEGLVSLGNAAYYDTRFHTIVLPSTLQLIGNECFRYSRLEGIDVPQSVVQIGVSAFENSDSLHWATLNEGLLYLRNSAFASCPLLQDVALPSSLRVLGEWAFYGNKQKMSYVQPPLINVVPNHVCCGCDSLTSVTLHERVTKIDGNAFQDCKQLTRIDLPQGLQVIGSWAFVACPLTELNIPSSVRTIDGRAFNDGNYTRVVLPEGVEQVGERAFYSKKLRYVDFPSTIAQLEAWAFHGDGDACDSIVLRAALPPRNWGDLYRTWHGGALYVPAASVDAYKQDKGFKGFTNILSIDDTPGEVVVSTSLSTDSVWFPVINNVDLTITHNPKWTDGFYGGHLHVGSQTKWDVNHLRYDYRLGWHGWDEQLTATLINEGTMSAQSMEMNLVYYPNEWFFFTPPFDMKASDLTCTNTRVPFVLRTFDGSRRAAGDHGNVWQNVSRDATLKAGQGYILQYGYEQCQVGYEEWSTKDEDVCFRMSAAQPLRTLSLSSEPVTIELTDFRGEFPHNEGWNLVGNPYMSCFDISHLESDAPIVVATKEPYTSFETFSPLDDEYVLRPLRAFLIQRSEQQTSVTFDPAGRQTDLVVHHESVNSARNLRRAAKRRDRTVFNIRLMASAGNTGDAGISRTSGDSLLARTRVVLTPHATEGYDRGQDAPFITMDDKQTALYTRSGGLRYSQNEQPLTTTGVQVGMHLAQAGTYTLTVDVRGEAAAALQGNVLLIDRETGERIDILNDPCTFTVSDPCTMNNRFELQLGDGITSLESVEVLPQQSGQLYDLQGRRITAPTRGIYIQNRKKFIK